MTPVPVVMCRHQLWRGRLMLMLMLILMLMLMLLLLLLVIVWWSRESSNHKLR